ncbi:Cdc73 family RNA pol II accessory factor [Pseudomassariella vexata]|uniref:Cdc73 family RNA pol II accessory factor n=1 Tax=Pseudomassariella vexata TaxID=1141098 RepID=A0A1Y2DUB4_9PEZI|nr:Cdc73 family RNA pol II accessory factor [Pseudomassariella vexata]ORY62882.1 Cdc73 family RNA pol II accessory factor [Pseudomassariella vexata]
MATPDLDPLLLLRQSIASNSAILPTASTDAAAPEASLSTATHLTFTTPTRISIPIDTPTRFASNDTPVDLRSIYFAWLKREVAIPEYNASATQLNDDLTTGKVQNLAFVERLDLITWLEGASEESEYIKPLAGDKHGAASNAAAALASKGAAAPAIGTTLGRSGKGALDPRLAVIYNSERKMGNWNSALRGIKPTDFSHVRKLAAPFMSKKPSGNAVSHISSNPSLALNQKQKRPDPIILLSPSASALLRMTNIKSFLESGKYVPVDSLTASSSSSASMLHINRLMKDIDPNRPMRFILVEGPEQFKPEYWSRVVAVFTTGQSWQFKNYKWSNPNELFRHVLGVYVGWRHEQPPEAVQAWGHRVMAVGVERWKDMGPNAVDSSRWRDREAVEQIWKAIEGNMRSKGWKKDQAPASI